MKLRHRLTMLRLGLRKNDLVEREGIFYHKFTNVPFPKFYPPIEKGRSHYERGSYVGDQLRHGLWEDYHHNGQLLSKSNWNEGERNGPYVTYHDNGQLLSKGTYKDDWKDGPWVNYWKDGQLQDKGTYKDGKKHGPWIRHHINGQLASKKTYKNGKQDGPWVEIRKNGWLKSKGTYKDGKREGPWVFYDGNEQKDFNGVSGDKWWNHEGSGTYKGGVKISD